MAEPKISIKFQGRGAKKLKTDIQALHIANVLLTKGMKAAEIEAKKVAAANTKLGKALKKNNTRTRNLAGTFSGIP